MRHGFRIAVAAILFALVAVGLSAPLSPIEQAAAAGPPSNGKLLYSGTSGQLRDLSGGRQTLPFSVGRPASFSPDGSMIASYDRDCSATGCTEYSLRIYSASGSTKKLAFSPQRRIEDITWSPDQRYLAVSIWAGNDSLGYNIWIVPVNDSPARLALASTEAFSVPDPGIAWRPTSNEIAFIGEPDLDDDTPGAEEFQPYLIGAFGGSPTRFNAPLPDTDRDCPLTTCRRVRYYEPTWSPDGNRLAAYIEDDVLTGEDDDGNFETHTFDEYVGVVAQRQAAPTKVKEIQHLVNPGSPPHRASNQPVWSADGKDILYERQTSPPEAKAALVTIQGGAEVPVASPDYRDWQPCPTGACVPWGARDKADLKLTVTGYDKTTAVGNQDQITATVANLGPDTARNVNVKVATPKGMFYTEVVKPPAPWTCDQSTKGSVSCGAPELASGAKVSFKVGLFALDVRSKAELVVRASTDSYDLVSKNDTVRLAKKLVKPKPPKLVKGKKPPKAAGGCNYPGTPQRPHFKNYSWCTWYEIPGKKGLWFTAKSLTCTRQGGTYDSGYVAGVLWIFEGGKSGVTKLMVNARRQAEDYGLLKGGERNKSTNTLSWPNDKKDHQTWVSFSWENGGFDAYKVTAEYKWVKKGLRRNVEFKTKVMVNC